MRQPNYYEILGVDEDADPKTIEDAYWRLLKEYHPDTYRKADAKQRIAQVNAAYQVLSNPLKRAEYDARLERLQERAAEEPLVAVQPAEEPAVMPEAGTARADKTSARIGIGRLLAFAAVVVVIILGGAWAWTNGGGEGTGSVNIGQEAPEISLPTLDGGTVSLAELRGKAILINFWASWCPPCREEMPDLDEAYRKYKENGLVVLAVNIQEDKGTVSDFMQRLGLSFPVALDTSGAVSERYKVFSLPTSYFVDRDGVIRDLSIGRMTRETIEAKLKKIL